MSSDGGTLHHKHASGRVAMGLPSSLVGERVSRAGCCVMKYYMGCYVCDFMCVILSAPLPVTSLLKLNSC